MLPVVVFESLCFRCPHQNDQLAFSDRSTLESICESLRFLVTENPVYVWTGGQNAEKSIRFHTKTCERGLTSHPPIQAMEDFGDSAAILKVSPGRRKVCGASRGHFQDGRRIAEVVEPIM